MPNYHNIGLVTRYEKNPILTARDFPDEYQLAHVFNSGITTFRGKYLMVCRCEDAALKPYFWLADSDDGLNFTPRAKPIAMPMDNPEFAKYADYNFYDPRVTQIGDAYYITHAAHSSHDCRTSLHKTTDFEDFEWLGYISEPGNRNCLIFPEKINGLYARLERPMTTWDSGDIWISYSPDLIYWGKKACVLRNTEVLWAWSKIGGGAVPIRTEEGWLNIFHGVRTQGKGHLVYQLGVCLHDLNDPSQVIALGQKAILQPLTDYEMVGQTPSIVFTGGAVPEADGSIKIYYGGADSVQCVGFSTIETLLDVCHNRV